MNPCSGPLDGHIFTADLPFVIVGWPAKSAITTFESKQSVWNYLEAALRRDSKAILARAYEFTGGSWQRIPPIPTYLTRLEINLSSSAALRA